MTNKKPNVTVIPSRYHAVSQEKDEGKNCGLLLIAVFPRTASNRRQAMRHKLNIIQNIKKNPEWELAGIFADEGLSGTDTRKRGEFNCRPGNGR